LGDGFDVASLSTLQELTVELDIASPSSSRADLNKLCRDAAAGGRHGVAIGTGLKYILPS
jgi:hypothetical protein